MSVPESPTGILTFLIADVRGYTAFTQAHGDEGAARLADKFAELAREGVEAFGGEVTELRGDEALCVFTSPRAALRAAVALQTVFVDETVVDPSLPLTVGMGLDAGEAVPVQGGYRGGALNLAARLCSRAVAGEVLVSQGIAHLARAVKGIEL
jgi:class 3 adenylate cyclase